MNVIEVFHAHPNISRWRCNSGDKNTIPTLMWWNWSSTNHHLVWTNIGLIWPWNEILASLPFNFSMLGKMIRLPFWKPSLSMFSCFRRLVSERATRYLFFLRKRTSYESWRWKFLLQEDVSRVFFCLLSLLEFGVGVKHVISRRGIWDLYLEPLIIKISVLLIRVASWLGTKSIQHDLGFAKCHDAWKKGNQTYPAKW